MCVVDRFDPMRSLLLWCLGAILWEATVLGLSYWSLMSSDRSGLLDGGTYEKDPLSWFVMTAMWIHFFAVPISAGVGAVIYAVWSSRKEGTRRV